MSSTHYECPQSLDEAIALLSRTGEPARILAGGTDLLVQMRGRRVTPERIVDIKKIPTLRGIEVIGGGFRIGAATSGAEIGEHEALGAAWPGVVEAAELIGSTQIQGRATLGGNICNASPAADTVPALIAAGATCTIAGPSGSRDVPVEEVGVAPGKNCLAPGELLIAINLPARPARSGDAYLRLIPRSEMDIAVVGAGVSLTLDADGSCIACRVGLGAVAARALRVDAAADALIGTRVDADALARLAAAASEAAKPIDDKRGTVAYRKRVAGVLARRAAAIAVERASGRP